MRAFLQGPKPELLHHQRIFENGTAERAKESGTEQNYNMIDGCVNNVPKKPGALAAGGRCLIGCILSRLSGDKKTIRRSRNRKEAEKVKIP